MSHYNTTNETGKDLNLLRGKARKQEESILALFKTMPSTEMSAWHVERYTSYPITSVRRAITDLTQAGEPDLYGAQARWSLRSHLLHLEAIEMTKRERLAEIRRQADELENEINAEELITVTFKATQDTINRYHKLFMFSCTDKWDDDGYDPLFSALDKYADTNRYWLFCNGEPLKGLPLTVEIPK